MLSLPARILVADDEPLVRALLGMMLARHFPQCTVALVADGEAALAHYDAHGADVILTDGEMPRFTGHDLARLLRARGDDVPIGIMSGLDVRRGSYLLADAVLEKPFNVDMLVHVVRELVTLATRELTPA